MINHISYNSLFILFLMISTNFTSDILPKSLRIMLQDNLLVKHFLAFFILFFFIIIIHPEKKMLSYFQLVKSGILIYLLFFFICISRGIYFLISIFLCSLIYILHLKEDTLILKIAIQNNIQKNTKTDSNNNSKINEKIIKTYQKNNNNRKRKRIIKTLKKVIIFILYITIILGVIDSYFKKKEKFKKNFNFLKFLFYKKK